MESFAIHITNLPDVISSLTATRASVIANTPVSTQTTASSDPPAGAYTLVVPYPPAFGAGSDVIVQPSLPESSEIDEHELRTITPTSSVDFDLGKLPLPVLTNITMTSTGVTWTSSGAGHPDGMLAHWHGAFNNGKTTVFLQWDVIQPFNAAGMTLPILPPADAEFDPSQHPGMPMLGDSSVTTVAYDTAGYDEVRSASSELLLLPLRPTVILRDKAFQSHAHQINGPILRGIP